MLLNKLLQVEAVVIKWYVSFLYFQEKAALAAAQEAGEITPKKRKSSKETLSERRSSNESSQLDDSVKSKLKSTLKAKGGSYASTSSLSNHDENLAPTSGTISGTGSIVFPAPIPVTEVIEQREEEHSECKDTVDTSCNTNEENNNAPISPKLEAISSPKSPQTTLQDKPQEQSLDNSIHNETDEKNTSMDIDPPVLEAEGQQTAVSPEDVGKQSPREPPVLDGEVREASDVLEHSLPPGITRELLEGLSINTSHLTHGLTEEERAVLRLVYIPLFRLMS